jgi:hypothetical protein
MEAGLLGKLGKLAGIAGVGLGVLLLIFRGILAKNILPAAGLSSAQGFTVIMAMMILTFGIAGIGVVGWL